MLTSSANPLLKDVRRALARGGLTEHGDLVAETFHLLEVLNGAIGGGYLLHLTIGFSVEVSA